MADLADVYAVTRKDLAGFVSSLSEQEVERPVPATPGWSIRDVVAHMAGVLDCIARGDFPAEFFVDVGSKQGVAVLNEWTDRQVGGRADRPIQELLDEWENGAVAVMPMLRGDVAWPDGVVPFAGYVLITDLAVHQQDVYGALRIVKGRDTTPVGIGFATYVGGADLKLKGSGGPSLRVVTERKEVVAGDGEPAATVRGSRFELFRGLSGRRSPDQLRAYEWAGDPEPFLELFYPYGVRAEALVE